MNVVKEGKKEWVKRGKLYTVESQDCGNEGEGVTGITPRAVATTTLFSHTISLIHPSSFNPACQSR